MLHLARKAFYPARVPFPLLHIDTTWKFREMIEFRDRFCAAHDLDLSVHTNARGAREGVKPVHHGSNEYTTIMKTEALLPGADRRWVRRGLRRRAPRRGEVARQGAHLLLPRRHEPVGPEEPAPRALEPLQRPGSATGESIRVFPLSNWTELDVWQYIHLENIPIVPLYFADEAAGGASATAR